MSWDDSTDDEDDWDYEPATKKPEAAAVSNYEDKSWSDSDSEGEEEEEAVVETVEIIEEKPEIDVNVWERPDINDFEDEEPYDYEEVYYTPPDVIPGEWRDVENRLNELERESLTESEKRSVLNTVYHYSKPVWEAIGEDRHVSFVVDLDALLSDIVESNRIDFDHGLQVLPCIHLLEKRLKQLRSGGRNPMIVVFDCLQTIWPDDRDDIQLLRQILILHLSSLKNINVFRFENFWYEPWLKFIREWLPAFTVIMAPGCKSVRTDCHHVFEAMLAYIQYCQDVPCVLSSTLRIKSNALYGHKFYNRPCRRFCRKFFGSFDGMEPLLMRSFSQKSDLDADLWQNTVEVLSTDDLAFQLLCYTCAHYLKTKKDKSYIALLVLSFELKKLLSLEQRRFVLPEKYNKRLGNFLNEIYHIYGSALYTFNEHAVQINEIFVDNIRGTEDYNGPQLLLCFSDLIDGRLLYRLAQSKALLQDEVRLGVSEDVLTEVKAKWDIIVELSGVECSDFFPILERDELKTDVLRKDDALHDLITPYEQKQFVKIQSTLQGSLFDVMDADLAKRDLLAPDIKEEPSYFWKNIEKNNWQPGEKVHDAISKHPPPVTVQEKRNAQKYLTFIEKYSKSLQPGKIVLRDVIVARAAKPEAEEEEEVPKGRKGKKGKKNKRQIKQHQKQRKGKGGKKGKNKKGGGLSVREQAKLEIEEKKREQKIRKTTNLINYLKSVYPNNPEGLELRIKNIDEKFAAEADPQSALPGLMQLREWCEEAAIMAKKKSAIHKIVRLWQVTHDILRRFYASLNIEQMKKLQQSMLIMGYDSAAASMVDYYCESLKKENRHVSVQDVLVDPDSIECQINAPASYQRFQLEHGGSLMVRSVDSAYDPRVDGFYPDKWQRDLLDVVDNKGSALVVAPTSSGKTFVSWYAMKETLINNKKRAAKDKRRVVYVCPTKALSQQAAAEIYAKYGDVFGIFTSDYDHKVLESEVTVVLPETFEIILTSSEREDYVNSIDYVIFDEVHCLDEGDGGEVWERLFMLVRCPFIALSATVGEPHIFQSWLTRVGRPFALSKAKKGTKYEEEIQLISHNLRWSDLQKYIYLPREYVEPTEYTEGKLHIKCFTGKHEWKSNCIDIHPAAAVYMGNGLNHFTNGFPPNLSFSPKDSLAFYDSMRKQAEQLHLGGDSTLMQSLNCVTPDNYFDPLVIKKAAAREWEFKLKEILWDWCKTGYREEANRVLEELAHVPEGRIQQLEIDCLNHESPDRDCYTFDYVADHITSLLIDLEQTDRLPALIFCLDRRECEQLLKRIVENLEQAEEAEERKRESQTTEERRADKKVQKDIKKIQKQIAALEKTSGRSKDNDDGSGTSRNNAAEQIDALEEQLASLMGSVNKDANAIDERFTFVKNGERLDEDELEYWKRRTTKRNSQLQGGTHINMRCLDRGIGLHHEGLSRTYKQLVETLFRAKQLKIVIATKTLAMGVNMPARTVIFAGDHPDLNPLAYRQMMGRAGRRGYDNIGHVCFLGIRPRKVAYLMTSELLSLTGHYPVKPTMCLKLAQQHAAFEERDECITSMQNLYTPPFDRRTAEDADATAQYKKNTRFLNEMLFHFNLMDNQGRCKGFGGVAAHLMSYEPANLVFTRLLETGIFHVLAYDYDPKNKDDQVRVANRLMLVLCHIFHFDICLPPETKGNVLPPISTLKLGRLVRKARIDLKEDKNIDQYLRQYDLEVQSLYEHFTQSMHELSECDEFLPAKAQLPLSKIRYDRPNVEAPDSEEITLMRGICEEKPPVRSLSSFTAISSPQDSFENKQDIILHGRDDFIFDSTSIPSSHSIDARGRKLQKNSFAYDFFCHGEYSTILKENHLRDGLCWNYLKRWQLLLKAIRHALRSISGLAHKLKEKEIENRRIANQQEKDTYTQWSDRRSIYKGALLLKDYYTGEVIQVLGKRGNIKNYEKVKETEDMIDQLVQAFSFLSKDFSEKFNSISINLEQK